MMPSFRASLISVDEELRAVARASDRIMIGLEVPVEATEVGVDELQALEVLGPDLILVDLGDEPELSLRLVQHLADSFTGRPILVVGPPPSAQLIMEAMRVGAAEYIEKPLDAEKLEDALARAGRRHAPRGATPAAKLGCVELLMGVKGGVGSTTIAASLAVALKERTHERVLLLDLDFGLGDAAIHLDLDPQYDVLDAIERLDRMDAGLLSSLTVSHSTGLQLLASPTEIERVEAVEPGQVPELLEVLRKHYDYIIVDGPHPFMRRAAEPLAEANRILLVTTPEVSGLRNVDVVLPLVRRKQEAGRGKVELVVNRYEPDRSLPVQEIERFLGLEVRGTIANDYELVRQASEEGRPVVTTGRTAVARDLDRLAAGILGSRDDGAPAPTGARRNLLQSLRNRGRASSGISRP